MTINVYIVGLNEVGASVACVLDALGENVVVTGFDLDPSLGRAARKAGTIKSVSLDMVKPARQADLVFVSLPASETPGAIGRIGPVLKEDAILFDLAPLKGVYLKDALAAIPEGRTYVGATPAINPEVLLSDPADPGTGNKDLFKDGVMALVISPHISEEKVERIIKLIHLFGAEPFFVDAGEVDGMMAVVRGIPMVASAAYLNSITSEPGWKESQRLAAREFYSFGRIATLAEPDEISTELLQNKDVVLHRLKNMITGLQAMQTMLEKEQEDELESVFEQAGNTFNSWLTARKTSDWNSRSLSPIKLPEQNLLGSLLGIRPRKKK
ncbi:MAG: prephenate dehydrogenase [Anaerolineales bacterium]|nr:prephenate dehydrogenase [Anaerolineales bacterium]